MRITWGLFLFETVILSLIRGNQIVFADGIYIVLIIFDSVVLLFELCQKEEGKIGNYILALIIRLFFLFWVEYCSDIFLMPNTGYDELKYYWNGYAYVVKGTTFTGYSGFVAFIFGMFGASKLFGSFLNLLLSIQTILFFDNTLEKISFSPSTNKKALFLLCVFPNYALSSSILLRESIIIFFASFSLMYFVHWWVDNKKSDLLIALLLTLPAIYFHTGMIAITAGYVCIAVSLQRYERGSFLKVFSGKSIFLFSITAVIGIILISQTSTEIGNVSSIADIVASYDVRATGGSAYDANPFSNDSVVGFAANTPIHMLYFLLSPLPWQWRSLSDVLAFFMSAAIYGRILYQAIKEKNGADSTALLKGMVIIIVFVLLIFGWGTANAGTALRHRDKAIVYYVLMYACLLECRNQREEKECQQ